MEKSAIPEETETIAAKRSKRLTQKILEARQKLNQRKAWWSNALVEILIVGIVFVLNVYLVIEYFDTFAYETAFSGPVIPLTIKLVQVFNVSYLKALQLVNIFFFMFFPISMYVFIRHFTERKLAAVTGILIISLPYYPFAETRINAALLAQDSAHMASLVIIPFALITMHKFIKEGKTSNLIFVSLTTALIALASPFGLLTYLIISLVVTFSEVLLGKGRLKLTRLIFALIIGAGLTSFWYNPGFIYWIITGPMGSDLKGTLSRLIPMTFFTLPILATFGYLLFDRKPQLQSLFVSFFLLVSFLVLSSAGGGIFSLHPSRYVPELGISLAFFIGIVFVRIGDYISMRELKINKAKPGINGKTLIRSATVLVLVMLIVGVILGKENVSQPRKVLGYWSQVEKSEIWMARDEVRGSFVILGYIITFSSVSALGFVSLEARKEQKSKIVKSYKV
ncbi:hypothetical protein IPM62_01640 [Candidatus Woesebacteria bacterium]|nr:MAG: hypothetical protein IPM62_01640 [Candidatus Woesebacteria bacterium]